MTTGELIYIDGLLWTWALIGGTCIAVNVVDAIRDARRGQPTSGAELYEQLVYVAVITGLLAVVWPAAAVAVPAWLAVVAARPPADDEAGPARPG